VSLIPKEKPKARVSAPDRHIVQHRWRIVAGGAGCDLTTEKTKDRGPTLHESGLAKLRRRKVVGVGRGRA
jgi:hypothetical protein